MRKGMTWSSVAVVTSDLQNGFASEHINAFTEFALLHAH